MSSLVLFLLFAVYLFPCFVAYSRDHRNAGAIFILNLFLGWTFLGWVAAFVWASTDNTGSTSNAVQL